MLIPNEIAPRNAGQAVFASMLMIIGQLIIAILFGEMVVIMASLNRKSTKFQEI